MSLLTLGLRATEHCTSALVMSSQSELGRICAQESLHKTALKDLFLIYFHLNWALHKGLMYVFECVSVSELNNLEGNLSSYSTPQILFNLLNALCVGESFTRCEQA